jgi:AcrR family transcriptional regulator
VRIGVLTGGSDDVKERILEVVRELRARGESITVRDICRRLDVSSYRFYQLFPGGLEEVLKYAEGYAEPKGSVYSRAFKLIKDGASPCKLVMELGLEPRRAEEIYSEYNRLMGID